MLRSQQQAAAAVLKLCPIGYSRQLTHTTNINDNRSVSCYIVNCNFPLNSFRTWGLVALAVSPPFLAGGMLGAFGVRSSGAFLDSLKALFMILLIGIKK